MMGYIAMIGSCIACNRMIHFNPYKVPSLMVNGVKEPLCESCANRWNKLHPDRARPILEDAYEAQNEDEL